MIRRLSPHHLLTALCLCASSALAGAAEDCRNSAFADADRVEPCTAAIEAAADPLERADLLLFRGAIQGRLGSLEAAEADFAAAETLRPDWADPHLERAYAYFDRGDPQAAADAALKGWEVEPGSAQAVQTALNMLGNVERWSDCLALAPHALLLAPEDPNSFVLRGRCQAGTGDFEAAAADFRRALELGSNEAQVHSSLAWSLLELGRAEEAIPAAKAALSLDPGNVNALRNLAHALVATEGPEAAAGTFRKFAPAEAASRVEVADRLAWDLVQAGRGDEGLPFAEMAMAALREIGANGPGVMDTYAHTLAAAGQPEAAQKAFLKAAANPEWTPVYAERLRFRGYAADAADPSSLATAFLACARTGAACRLSD